VQVVVIMTPPSRASLAFLQRAARAALVIVLASCSESTPPAPPAAIEVTLLPAAPSWTYDVDERGLPLFACSFDLHAEATGSGAAQWAAATFIWHWGADRTPIQGEIEVDSATIWQSWSSSGIAVGFPQTSRWRVWGPFSFDFEVRFRFASADSQPHEAVAHVPCGRAYPTDLAAPTIEQLGLGGHSGPWEPGDHTSVHFALEDARGLWVTALSSRGAVNGTTFLNEHRDTAAQHEFTFRVPSGVALGDSEVFTVQSYDEFAAVSDRSVAMTPFEDVTAPVVLGVPCARWTTCNGTPTLEFPGADYFVGDTLRMRFVASDNHALAWLSWSLDQAGVTDRVSLDGTRRNVAAEVVLQPSWAGLHRLRAWARDKSGNVGEAAHTASDAIGVFPTLQRPHVKASHAGAPVAVVTDEKRGLLYTLGFGAKFIGVRSLATMAVQDSIALPDIATSMDLSLTGDSLVVAMPLLRSLGIVKLDAPDVMTLVSVLRYETARYPYVVRVMADGLVNVLLGDSYDYYGGSGFRVLVQVNLRTGERRHRAEGGTIVQGIERSGNRQRLVLWLLSSGSNCGRVYDVDTDLISACTVLPWGNYPRVDLTGDRIAFGPDVYDGALQPISHSTMFARYEQREPLTAISPDGSTQYGDFGFGIVRSNTSTGRPIDRTVARPGLTFITPDGNALLVFWQGGDSTYKFDLSAAPTNAPIASLPGVRTMPVDAPTAPASIVSQPNIMDLLRTRIGAVPISRPRDP
jgi:hypothetical protein